MRLYLDIETIANKDLRPELFQDIMDNVKPDARATSNPDTSIRNKQMKLVGEFGLMPMTSLVCLVGIQVEGEPPIAVLLGEDLDEKALLISLKESIEVLERIKGQHVDTVVTFNGKSFDLPHLMVKCMKYGIHIPCIATAFHESKYALDRSTDLRDIFTNFDPYGRGTQRQWGLFLGLDIPDNGDGSEIQGMWDRGEKDAIITKNATDLLTLMQLDWAWIKATSLFPVRN